ncbi:MAG: hypothetical protein ACYDBO_02205 [Vulcanimicrobiaceae bacterium]
MERLRALDEMLEERSIDPRDVIIKGARITKGDWDVTAKVKEVDEHGNKIQRIVTTNNTRKGTEILFSPKFAEGPKWPVVQPGPTIIIKRVPRSAPLRAKGIKTVIIHADEQMGFWRDMHTDELTAFHDERAIDIVLQAIEDIQPDRVIGAGDLLDNPEWSSKFRKFPEFAGMTQKTVNRGTLYMAQLREAAGDKCLIDEVEGNHDARMPNYIIDNASAAHGLTRGYDQTKPRFRDQPALSVPNLLRMDEVGVNYTAAFPGGDVWLNEAKTLVVAHEDGKIAREERATLFHGHLHTAHDQWRTVWHFGEQRRRAVISVPCLARIDEIVDALERRMRSAIPASQVRLNWQQGFSIVHYREDSGTADFAHIPVQIVDGTAWVGDKPYRARQRDINGHLLKRR